MPEPTGKQEISARSRESARRDDLTWTPRRQAAWLEAQELLRVMVLHAFPGRIAAVSSFGAESAVLLDLVASVDPAAPVLFLETGKHFPETLAYRDLLTANLGLRDVRSLQVPLHALAREDAAGDLWRRDPDACCDLRKTRPLQRALAGFDAWVTGRTRHHGAERSALGLIERSNGQVKINPLAHWSADDIAAAMAVRGLPEHPLVAEGYLSIGCAPCTRRALCGADPRSGRWAGLGKTECGIHKAPWAATPAS